MNRSSRYLTILFTAAFIFTAAGESSAQSPQVAKVVTAASSIGRNVFRTCLGDKDIDFVAVNDLTDTRTLAHLLKYDSVMGNLENDITAEGDTITVFTKANVIHTGDLFVNHAFPYMRGSSTFLTALVRGSRLKF